MPETTIRHTAQSIIPDDPEASAYRFIIVAAKRARQLQGGARSYLPTTSKKPTVVAMEEVRRGLVQYEDLTLLPPNKPQSWPPPKSNRMRNGLPIILRTEVAQALACASNEHRTRRRRRHRRL